MRILTEISPSYGEKTNLDGPMMDGAQLYKLCWSCMHNVNYVEYHTTVVK